MKKVFLCVVLVLISLVIYKNSESTIENKDTLSLFVNNDITSDIGDFEEVEIDDGINRIFHRELDLYEIVVPEFLNQDQQNLYRQAYVLYNCMFGGDTAEIEYVGIVDDCFQPNTYEQIEIHDCTYKIAQGDLAKWADFWSVIDSLFTEKFWNSKNLTPHGVPIYINNNGRLCFMELSRGTGYFYNDNFEDTFELDSMTDSEITFFVVGHYSNMMVQENETSAERDLRVEEDFEFEYRFPIKMVLTEKGWRFDQYYTSKADELLTEEQFRLR